MGRHKASVGFIKSRIVNAESSQIYQSHFYLPIECKTLQPYIRVPYALPINEQKKYVFQALRQELARYDGIGKYLPEVGFNMQFDPPKPLMRADSQHLPAIFPEDLSKHVIESLSQGRFRLADIVILNIADHEIFKMHQTGQANWIRFYPDQRYIKNLIELDTLPSEWGVARQEAFREIFDMACLPLSLTYENDEIPQVHHDLDIPKIQNRIPYSDQKMTLLPEHLNKQRLFGRLISKCKNPVKMVTKETPIDEFQKKLTPVVLNMDYPIGMIFWHIKVVEKKKKKTIVVSHFATSTLS